MHNSAGVKLHCGTPGCATDHAGARVGETTVMHDARWRLTSTNGYSELVCEFVAERDSCLAHDVRLEQRLPASESGAAVAIGVLGLSPDRLAHLTTVLRAWLAQSLRGLALDPLDYSAELAVSPNESLSVTLGPPPMSSRQAGA